MRFASSLPIQRLAAVAMSSSSSSSASSSSRVNARGGRRPWRRGFCDRPPLDGTAPVSGDSHLRNVRDANYVIRRGQRGSAAWAPRGAQEQRARQSRPVPGGPGPPVPPFYGPPAPSLSYVPQPYFGAHASSPSLSKPPHVFRPSPPPRQADYYRNWNYSLSQPPSRCEKFVVLSYNILADYLAWEHRSQLYFHIPHYILDWEWRKKRLLLEFRLWGPDIMCLQEVDRFHDLEADLASQGYSGIWKMRTGKALDGCAIFWRTSRFQLRYEECIEFNRVGLRDNIAQICVLESRMHSYTESESASLSGSSNQSRQAKLVVICNIHVLYNPKRGDIKLGQVRTLLNRAHAVSKTWNDAPVIVCGDFNCTPKSPLYNFISNKKLDISGLSRYQVSGQYAGSLLYHGSAMPRAQQPLNNFSTGQIVDPQKPTGTMGIPRSLSESQFTSRNNRKSNAITNKIDGECWGGQAVEISSDQCSKGMNTSESCNQPSSNPGYVGNNENQEAIQTVCSSDDQSSTRTQNKLGGENNSDVSYFPSLLITEFSQKRQNETMTMDTNINEASCFKNIEPIAGVIKLSAEIKNKSNAPSADITFHEDSGVCEENAEGSGSPFLENSTKKSFGAFSGNVEESSAVNLGCSITDLNAEESNHSKSSALGDSAFSLMTLDSLVIESRKTVKQDSSSSCFLESKFLSDVSSDNCCNIDEYRERYLDASSISDSLEGFNHMGESDISCNHMGESDISCKELFTSEENSDTNFFRELLGTEAACKFTNDDVSATTSTQSQSSSTIHNLELDPSCVQFHDRIIDSSSPRAVESQKQFYNTCIWTPMEIEIASGNAESTSVEHSLELRSVYTDVEEHAGTNNSSKEPEVTSYNRQFMGTVDYIWSSQGLQTVKVLDTIPKHVLQQTPGFPTKKWGSDHVALACQLAFSESSSTN